MCFCGKPYWDKVVESRTHPTPALHPADTTNSSHTSPTFFMRLGELYIVYPLLHTPSPTKMEELSLSLKIKQMHSLIFVISAPTRTPHSLFFWISGHLGISAVVRLSLIYPFLALVLSCKHYKSIESKCTIV